MNYAQLTDEQVLRLLEIGLLDCDDRSQFRTDMGEQCVICGKNSWECEHFEEQDYNEQ